ncbi:MAG: zinc ribbon domain-containing protein [Dehalococcoidia bacterium]|nr:zinc ribbon domain-containing protein [Dehalococcoidia bacterium]MCB9486986.1 zinc ribbon domain-containing protein [Thermoflexaceae bacterium]
MSIDWPGGSWEATLQMVLLVLGTFLVMLWLATLYWTYRDIRQRTRDWILQGFSVALIVFLFPAGLAIYMILRPRYTLSELYERSLEEEALLQDLEDQKACPTCRRRVKDDFLVCPSCRTQLKELCRSCQRPLSYAWNACPYCGLEKAPRVQSPPPRPRVASAPPPPITGTGQLTSPPQRVQRAQRAAPIPSRSQPAADPFGRQASQAGDEGAVIDLVD